MDPAEVEAWLATLPPEMREQALAELGLGQANQVPPSFGGGMPGSFSPELSQGSYDLLSMGQMPPDIEYGEVQPFGLDELSQAYNIMQDRGALNLDPAIRMEAGPGAFAVGAFDPTIVPIGEPLDLAGGRYVDMLANSGPGYESYLATKIKSGMSPGQAVASMWADIQSPAPGQEELRDALVASLPPVSVDPSDPMAMIPSMEQSVGDFSTPQGQAASANVDAITAKATELFDRMASDPVPGYTDPKTGLPYAGSYEEPSEIAAKFAEYGLPTPEESYTDEKYLPPIDPETQAAKIQAMSGLGERLGQATAVRDQTAANMEEMTKAWENAQPAPTTPPLVGDDPNNPYGLSPSSMGAAQTAADIDWDVLKESGEGAPSLASFLNQERSKLGLAPIDASGGYTMPEFGQTDPQLQAQSVDAARGSYDDAYAQWEEENRKRLESEAQQRGAMANMGTSNPFVVSDNGQVLDTYNFAGTPDEQTAMGQLANVWGLLQGYSDPQTGAMQGAPSYYQPSVDASEAQWGDAYLDAERVRNYTTPDLAQRSKALGLASAMSDYGRTPLQDVLMQGSMGRQVLMPYTGY